MQEETLCSLGAKHPGFKPIFFSFFSLLVTISNAKPIEEHILFIQTTRIGKTLEQSKVFLFSCAGMTQSKIVL